MRCRCQKIPPPGEGGGVPDAEVRVFGALGQDAPVGLQTALLREGVTTAVASRCTD